MDEEKRMRLIEKYKALTIPELVHEFRSLKDMHDSYKEQASEVGQLVDLIRLNVLPDKMENEDVSTVTVAGAGRVSLQGDLYFSIPAAYKDDCFEWLRDNGHGDIIQETVNSSTGKAWAKEMMKQGQTLPEGLFKVVPFTRATITRTKEK